MRASHLLPLAAVAFGVACASSSTQSPGPGASPAPTTTPYPTPTPGAAATTWEGQFHGESGSSAAGTVTLAPGAAAGQSVATIALTGTTPNATHPWHVHAGTCAEKGAVVGPPAAYTPLSADASGAARAEVTLPFAPPSSGTYSVNVHMSTAQMGMIIACADLHTKG